MKADAQCKLSTGAIIEIPVDLDYIVDRDDLWNQVITTVHCICPVGTEVEDILNESDILAEI